MQGGNSDYQIELTKSILMVAGIFAIVGAGLLLGFFISSDGILLYVGTLFSLSWLVIIYVIYYRYEQKQLYHHGICIVTKYESIIDKKGEPVVNGSTHNGVYYVQTSWYDSISNTVYLFKSEFLFKNPEAYLKDIAGIDVYVDPKNFQRNYMDLQFLPRHFNTRRMS
ncbi:hypothetical protein MMG00_05415 [Ignatzschineria rhizosphaerae]|uniref:DUF3592 domain-containing protein n=1 Tax=Ignatzschineria rhizosphaerae TaxID=2923279 RepID=A0ABY3X963_9GAMM|nr:hypothetical protein [Ignatzschineria rhizosphaerae]UNM97290.1 hypothetical protein MMG00_05415 [Ignatzschineria rhizosphaerae]